MAIQMLEVTLDQQDLLDTENNPAIDRMTRYISILRDQCSQELNLVNDLLELQQLEAGTLPIELQSINLNNWLQQGVKLFQGRSQSHELQF